MKKRSRSLASIRYGMKLLLEDTISPDLSVGLRKCAEGRPLYSVLNAIMKMVVAPKQTFPTDSTTQICILTESIEEAQLYCKEPILKSTPITPTTLHKTQTQTPPGTGFDGGCLANAEGLPPVPQLNGSFHPCEKSVLKDKNSSILIDSSSSQSEDSDPLFTISMPPRKPATCGAVKATRAKCFTSSTTVSPLPVRTSRNATSNSLTWSSFFLGLTITPQMFQTAQGSSRWNDVLIDLYKYSRLLLSVEVEKLHPSQALYINVLEHLREWCSLMKCFNGPPLFNNYRIRLASKVMSLAENANLALPDNGDWHELPSSLDTIVELSKKLEQLITRIYTTESHT